MSNDISNNKTKINIKRLIIGGLVAGCVLNAISLLSTGFYVSEMMELLDSRGIHPPRSIWSLVVYLLMRFIWGFAVVWFYVATRPRFGPGPKTAVLIGLVFWLCTFFLMVVSYGMLGLFPKGMLILWASMTLLAILPATFVGAWIYREEE